eukprot:GHRR01030793.1.p2 GENE.GHRR01030793.1~~GHRR01030793.1.p2  ORF type:complete len:101 (-),score=31.91 GHRR01030793.1:410-712(-)
MQTYKMQDADCHSSVLLCAVLCRAHTVDYVESVKAMSEDQSKVVHRIGDESAFMPGGFDIAALAAGGAITATEQVLAGDLANVYALCRSGIMGLVITYGF